MGHFLADIDIPDDDSYGELFYRLDELDDYYQGFISGNYRSDITINMLFLTDLLDELKVKRNSETLDKHIQFIDACMVYINYLKSQCHIKGYR